MMKEKLLEIINNKSLMTESFIIAIDGKAGAGKTTLAHDLAEELNAPIIPMDDFFLPFSMRNESRLEEPGGNVHYERFAKEVIPFLLEGEEIEYQPFDCSTGELGNPIRIPGRRLYIVEGSYSHHPYFQEYYDFSIFVDINPKEQMKRIQERNGDDASIFAEKWIPMENRYFDHYKIKEQADYILQMNEKKS